MNDFWDVGPREGERLLGVDVEVIIVMYRDCV